MPFRQVKPVTHRIEEALAHTLQRLLESGDLRRGALLDGLNDTSAAVHLPAYNVLDGNEQYALSPLYWLAPEISIQAWNDNWVAMFDLIATPEENETAAIREYFRSSEDFFTVRSRKWLLGEARDHKHARLLPTLQMLALQAVRIADAPVVMREQELSVTVSGRSYGLKGDNMLVPRLWGGPLIMPHSRTHQYLTRADFDVESSPLIGGGVQVLEPLFTQCPEIPAMLHAIRARRLPVSATIRKALMQPPPLVALQRYLMRGTVEPENRILTELDQMALDQAMPDLELDLLPGAYFNVSGLYHLLALDMRIISKPKFIKMFGEPALPGNEPRVELVSGRKRYIKWKERIEKLLADAYQTQ